MLTPSNDVWVCPFSVAGASTPSTSRMVGTMSMAWWYCSWISPRAVVPAGHEMMHGSLVPPLNW